MGARREVMAAVAERYRVGGAGGEGADSRRAVRGDRLASQARGAGAGGDRPAAGPVRRARQRERLPTTLSIKDALTALWEASDRICGKRLKVMIPTLLPALERHGRLQLGAGRSCAGAGGQRSNDRPAAGRHEDRGGGRPAPSRRLLLRHSARGPDPHVQRLEGSAAGLLRDRHGRARWHVGGGLVHPDADDGGCRDGLDGVPAAW